MLNLVVCCVESVLLVWYVDDVLSPSAIAYINDDFGNVIGDYSITVGCNYSFPTIEMGPNNGFNLGLVKDATANHYLLLLVIWY